MSLFWLIKLICSCKFESRMLTKVRTFFQRYRREQQEIERLHNMTDEERRLEMKLKPKLLMNKATKGKYKFLQKYYHRGVFFLVINYVRNSSCACFQMVGDVAVIDLYELIQFLGQGGRSVQTRLFSTYTGRPL